LKNVVITPEITSIPDNRPVLKLHILCRKLFVMILGDVPRHVHLDALQRKSSVKLRAQSGR